MDSTPSTPTLEIIAQPPVPTMRIVDADQSEGFVTINKADFDKTSMVDFDAPKPRRSAAEAVKPDAAATTT